MAVRALKWSHNDQWMASADHDGFVKYWQPNMNNVHMFQAHKDEPIRGLRCSSSCFAMSDINSKIVLLIFWLGLLDLSAQLLILHFHYFLIIGNVLLLMIDKSECY